ncbi:MAG: glycosyltransferase family 2 protein [Clostridia bacterium]|nr:glycosyltransferase family 2 protein [Clostridia bacterium]
MKVLLIIPAYNEAGNLPRLFKALRETCEPYDILVVNDASQDETEEVCRQHGVRFVNLPINLGIGGAVQTGYRFAYRNGYDVAVQVDGDGQHNPVYIKDLIDQIQKGYDLCIGSRFLERQGFQSSIYRRVGILYFSRLIGLITGKTITDPTSGFRACSRRVIKLFSEEYPNDYPEPETVVMVLKNQLNVCEIPVTMNARESGISSITPMKALYYMIKVGLAVLIASISKRSVVSDHE